MKKDIIELAPQLKISSEQVTKLMKVVQKQKIECDKVRTIVLTDEAHAKVNFKTFTYQIKRTRVCKTVLFINCIDF